MRFQTIVEHNKRFKYRIEQGNLSDEEWDILQDKIIALAERHGAKVLKLEKPEAENNRGVGGSPQI